MSPRIDSCNSLLSFLANVRIDFHVSNDGRVSFDLLDVQIKCQSFDFDFQRMVYPQPFNVTCEIDGCHNLP